MTFARLLLALALLLTASPALAAGDAGGPSSVEAYALRLHPGDDLKQSIVAFAKALHLHAAYVATCVGSLRETHLRLADHPETTTFAGKMEIVSLVGTLAENGAHLHLSVSDGQGRTLGGHLVDGCRIYTTAEIVLCELPALRFDHRLDPATTYQELVIGPR